jgi:hypothetical protein
MSVRSVALALGAMMLFGCVAAPRGAFRKGFDPASVQEIAVGAFGSGQGSGGEFMRDLFIQELLRRGMSVKAEPSGARYVLKGVVSRFMPERQFMIYSGTQNAVIVNHITEVPGSMVYNVGPVFGLQSEQVVVSNATVGVSARLEDTSTGDVLWTGSFTYEALSVDTAAQAVARYLVNALFGGASR